MRMTAGPTTGGRAAPVLALVDRPRPRRDKRDATRVVFPSGRGLPWRDLGARDRPGRGRGFWAIAKASCPGRLRAPAETALVGGQLSWFAVGDGATIAPLTQAPGRRRGG